jgi:K+-sensing histidine kinase KdpD
MKNNRYSSRLKLLSNCLLAMLTVAAVTIPLFLIGRSTLGEGAIALLYILPITWSASRWGLVPGLSAAVTATLCFDYLFIPPFYTFTVGNLEGWLVLAIFLGVAIFVVERIQANQLKTREATFMYELSAALSSQRTQEAIAMTVARQIQQLYQTTLVKVTYRSEKPSANIVVSQPAGVEVKGRPDRILPILNTWGLMGEIQIWRGPYMELPPEDSRLLQNFACQAARAFERAQPLEAEQYAKGLIPIVPAK